MSNESAGAPGGEPAGEPASSGDSAAASQASATPLALGASAMGFAACAGIGIGAGLVTWFIAAALRLHMDQAAFFSITAFAVAHVGAILILGPRFEAKDRGTQRGISILAAIVWTTVVVLTVGGISGWSAYRARVEAAATADEAARTEAILGAGGWKRMVLDVYVPLMDVDHLGDLFVAIGGVQEAAILSSPDHGKTWNRVDLPAHVNTLWRVKVVAPDRVYVLATSAERGAFFLTSTDGGATWTERPSPVDARAIVCDSPDVCWIAGNDPTAALKVFATTDGGATWTLEHTEPAPPNPIHYSIPHCVRVAEPAPAAICFSAATDKDGGHGGFALRRDLGAGLPPTWTRTDLGPTIRRFNDAWSNGSVVLTAGATAVATPAGTPSARGNVLLRSDDGGRTFSPLPFGIGADMSPVAVDFISDSELWVIVGDGLHHSTDAGATFVEDEAIKGYAAMGTTYMRDLAMAPDGTGVVIKENGSLLVRASRLDQ